MPAHSWPCAPAGAWLAAQPRRAQASAQWLPPPLPPPPFLPSIPAPQVRPRRIRLLAPRRGHLPRLRRCAGGCCAHVVGSQRAPHRRLLPPSHAPAYPPPLGEATSRLMSRPLSKPPLPFAGLPEELAHTKQALARGYAVVAVDAASPTRCFGIHADQADVVAILKDWLKAQALEARGGASSGTSCSGTSCGGWMLVDVGGCWRRGPLPSSPTNPSHRTCAGRAALRAGRVQRRRLCAEVADGHAGAHARARRHLRCARGRRGGPVAPLPRWPALPCSLALLGAHT